MMQMITRKYAMLIWARRGVGGVSMCLEGSGFPVARGIICTFTCPLIIRRGKRAFLEEDADALFVPGRETGSVN